MRSGNGKTFNLVPGDRTCECAAHFFGSQLSESKEPINETSNPDTEHARNQDHFAARHDSAMLAFSDRMSLIHDGGQSGL